MGAPDKYRLSVDVRTRPPDLRTLPSKHEAHPEFAADLLDVYCFAFVRKARISNDIKQGLDRDSAVMISSTMPSAKYGEPSLRGYEGLGFSLRRQKSRRFA